MTAEYQVFSVMEMVDIQEIQNSYQTVLDSSFSPEEQLELAKRHIRSTAGVLALKKALCGLILETTDRTVEEKELIITRLKSGKPSLVTWPDSLSASSLQIDNLFLSISHSRTTACGLAVYQEPADG